jgi:hypothetical protein
MHQRIPDYYPQEGHKSRKLGRAYARGVADSTADAEREVRALARAYYVAFRSGDVRRAAKFVADRLLETSVVVGTNINADEDDRVRLPRSVRAKLSRKGKRVVRARRRRWTEVQRLENWTVDDVVLDKSGERARVDTSAEGSYWIQRVDGKWKIVAFGSPTTKGLRDFGGEWERGPAIIDPEHYGD